MPNVRFNLKSGDNPKIIFLVLRTHGSKFRFSTTLKIDDHFWNPKKSRVKSLSGIDHESYNEILDTLEAVCNKRYRQYLVARNRKEIDSTFPTFQTFIRAALLPIVGKKEKTGEPFVHSLFSFVEQFISRREKLPDYSKGTITVYKTVKKHLLEFNKIWHRKLNFDTIDLEFAYDFQDYLFNEKSFKPNYVNKIIQQLRNFLNAALEEGHHNNTKYKSKRFQVSKVAVQNIYLTLEELKELFYLSIPDRTPGIAKARDLFLVGCFTGLRYSDFSTIQVDDIKKIEGVEVIQVTTQKTGAKVTIPLHPFVKAIFERHEGPPKGITNQKLNEHLKDLIKLTSFKDDIGIKGPKWKEVTTHTARRSFATNAFLSGVPTLSIMKITGHRTEKEFLKYIAISGEVNAKVIADHQFFKEHLKAIK